MQNTCSLLWFEIYVLPLRGHECFMTVWNLWVSSSFFLSFRQFTNNNSKNEFVHLLKKHNNLYKYPLNSCSCSRFHETSCNCLDLHSILCLKLGTYNTKCCVVDVRSCAKFREIGRWWVGLELATKHYGEFKSYLAAVRTNE